MISSKSHKFQGNYIKNIPIVSAEFKCPNFAELACPLWGDRQKLPYRLKRIFTQVAKRIYSFGSGQKQLLQANEIAAGNTVELRNFGVFETVVQRSRVGRNPRHPENEVVIPDRMVAKFRAGSNLKKKLEELDTDNFLRKTN